MHFRAPTTCQHSSYPRTCLAAMRWTWMTQPSLAKVSTQMSSTLPGTLVTFIASSGDFNEPGTKTIKLVGQMVKESMTLSPAEVPDLVCPNETNHPLSACAYWKPFMSSLLDKIPDFLPFRVEGVRMCTQLCYDVACVCRRTPSAFIHTKNIPTLSWCGAGTLPSLKAKLLSHQATLGCC